MPPASRADPNADQTLAAAFLRGQPSAVETVSLWLRQAAGRYRSRLPGDWNDCLQDLLLEVTLALRDDRFRGDCASYVRLADRALPVGDAGWANDDPADVTIEGVERLMAETEQPGDLEMDANCAGIAELLPFLLNGSLADAEARTVEAHLATCPACRREEREARTAQALIEGHLPVELLVDFALERPMSERSSALIESHLARCTRCAGEIATVRQEHSDAEPDRLRRPAPGAGDRGSGWRTLAVAASITAVVAGSGWLATWRPWEDRDARPAAMARINQPVVELLPATRPLLRRGSPMPEGAANRVRIEVDQDLLVLVLLWEVGACTAPCTLEAFDATTTAAAEDIQPRWRLPGLRANRIGQLTVAVPRAWLPVGRTVLVARDSTSSSIEVEYLIEIVVD